MIPVELAPRRTIRLWSLECSSTCSKSESVLDTQGGVQIRSISGSHSSLNDVCGSIAAVKKTWDNSGITVADSSEGLAHNQTWAIAAWNGTTPQSGSSWSFQRSNWGTCQSWHGDQLASSSWDTPQTWLHQWESSCSCQDRDHACAAQTASQMQFMPADASATAPIANPSDGVAHICYDAVSLGHEVG